MLVVGQREGILQTFRVWVQNQFHVEAEYRSLGLVAGQEFQRFSPVDSGKLKWGFPHFGDWIIPVEVENVHLGQIKIKNGAMLDSPSLSRIFHFVDLSLAPQLYREYLALEENNLSLSAEFKGFTSQGQLSFIEQEPELLDLSNERCGTSIMEMEGSLNKLLSSVIILHGEETFRFRTIAQSIRERVGTYVVFLDFKDIASEMRTSQDYRKLSHVCLFVAEEDLAIEENRKSIQIFLDQVASSRDGDLPMLILGLRSHDKFKKIFVSGASHRIQTISIDRWPLQSTDVTKVLDLILD